LTRDPFRVHTDLNFSSDGFTRVALFVHGLRKDSDANYLPVSVRVDGCPLEVCELPVEFVADAPGLDGVAQVFVRLPEELSSILFLPVDDHDLKVSIIQHDERSNRAIVACVGG